MAAMSISCSVCQRAALCKLRNECIKPPSTPARIAPWASARAAW